MYIFSTTCISNWRKTKLEQIVNCFFFLLLNLKEKAKQKKDKLHIENVVFTLVSEISNKIFRSAEFHSVKETTKHVRSSKFPSNHTHFTVYCLKITF